MSSPKRILWVATKPPWPPIDGGRLVMATTIEALLARGHRITVVAPAVGPRPAPPELPGLEVRWVEARLPSPAVALTRSLATAMPWSVARHRLPAVERSVVGALRDSRFDLVWTEQLQALSSVPTSCPLPLVLRMQNVESDLWRQMARIVPRWQRPLFLVEALRLARSEARGLARARCTLALTPRDAELLEHATGRRVEVVAAPFPGRLPCSERRLHGDPALVVLGGSWRPNRDGLRWLLEELWDDLGRRGAHLHVFGEERPSLAGITFHPELQDSREAFARDSILLVPLRVASGVRMKILEAWARRTPVIASSIAARGLDARSGRELQVADTAAELAVAVETLAQPSLGESIVERAATLLAERHAPASVAAQTERLLDCCARS